MWANLVLANDVANSRRVCSSVDRVSIFEFVNTGAVTIDDRHASYGVFARGNRVALKRICTTWQFTRDSIAFHDQLQPAGNERGALGERYSYDFA